MNITERRIEKAITYKLENNKLHKKKKRDEGVDLFGKIQIQDAFSKS